MTATSPLPSPKPDQPAKTPRLFLVDDNIRTIGGHFFELASLLLAGADSLGYRPTMATHVSFDQVAAVPEHWNPTPTFHTRRMVRWSLGVDGRSDCQRDEVGNPIGLGFTQKIATKAKDFLQPPAKRPAAMLDAWSADLKRFLGQVRPVQGDALLVNTGDDFAMLALARTLQAMPLPPMAIHIILHFALCDADQPDRADRLRMIGRQIGRCVTAMAPHQVHLHCTTDSLAQQLRDTGCKAAVNSIPYPTRARPINRENENLPIKAVLAGLPRAEKGRDAIATMLSAIEPGLLRPGTLQLSMQMPANGWEKMVPQSMHRSFRQARMNAVSGSGDPTVNQPLEVMTANLSPIEYHQWLDTADLGLFLYDAQRYQARCSGVLLEMLARGVPVIVPDRCWLADQVRLAGGHRSIGLIYQDRGEVPELIRQFVKNRREIKARSITHAATILKRHSGENTLRSMGFESVRKSQAA